MSYIPDGRENFSEFMASWATSDQNLPVKTSGSETTQNFKFSLGTLSADGEATLSDSTVSTNSTPALWWGDIRAQSSSTTFNQWTIEFDNNNLIRNAAYQDQRLSYADDICYAITNEAVLKLKIMNRSGGNTIAPFVRILGVLLEQ